MKKITLLKPQLEGECDASPSLWMASVGVDPIFREVLHTTTITNWENFYETRYLRRSQKRLRSGFQKIQELCNDFLTGNDDHLWNDNEHDNNPTNEVPANLANQSGANVGNQSEVNLGNQSRVNLANQSENVIHTGGSEDALEDHYVSTEISGDNTKIYVICRCGAQHQMLVTGTDCYFTMYPPEDISGEFAKLIWACKNPNELLIGVDCTCGIGFLLKKSGPSLMYCMRGAVGAV